MKGFYLISMAALAVLTCFRLSATPVDVAEARNRVDAFLKAKSEASVQAATMDVKAVPGISSLPVTINVAGAPLYVFPIAGDGFVIAGADDALPPIVGYSFVGGFDADDVPPQLQTLLAERWLANQSHGLSTNVGTGLSTPAAEHSPGLVAGEAVAPLLSTNWHQDEPFNNLLTDADGKNYSTGCTTIATAQVMKHYEWPLRGSGNVGAVKFLGTTSLTSTYAWASMLDVYRPGFYTTEESMAVAVLMRDVGVALGSEFGAVTNASICAPYLALVRNFGYSPDIKFGFRNSFTEEGWIATIRNELLHNRPVIYTGQSATGGHAFVCDGIDADNLLHVNWGWGGKSDGYFDMNLLAPMNPVTGIEQSYKRLQTIVYNICPNDDREVNPDTYRAPLSLMCLYIEKDNNPGDVVADNETLVFSFEVANTTGYDVDPDNPIEIVPVVSSVNGEPVKTLHQTAYAIDNLKADLITTKNLNIEVPVDSLASLPDGEYVIGLRYVYPNGADATNDALMVFNGGDRVSDKPFFKSDGKVLFSGETSLEEAFGQVELLAATTNGNLHIDAGPNIITLSLHNSSDRIVRGFSPYHNARGHLVLVPYNEDGPDIDLGAFARIPFECYLYPCEQTDVDIPVDKMEKSCPSPGYYRVYTLLSQGDGFPEHILFADEAVYVKVSRYHDGDKMLFGMPFELNCDTYERSNHGNDIGLTLYPIINRTYNGKIQVRARYLGEEKEEDADLEFIIYDSGDYKPQIAVNDNFYTSPSLLSTKALFNAPLGRYEAAVLYEGAAGEMLAVEGDYNSFLFELIDEVAEDGLLELASPAVINNGQPIPLGNVEFEVTAEIATPAGFDFSENPLQITVTDNDGNDVAVWPVTLACASDYSKTATEPGDVVSVTFHLASAEADCGVEPGDEFRLALFTHADNHVREYPHGSSLKFGIVETSGIGETIQDRAGPRVVIEGGTLVIECAEKESRVNVYNHAGSRLLQQRIVGTHHRVDVDALAPGIYIVTLSGTDRHTFKIKK